MEAAKKGIITPEMEIVAKKEYIDAEELRELVAKGEVCIPCNVNHKAISPEGIGTKMRTKINVNLGISGDAKNYDIEMQNTRKYNLRKRTRYYQGMIDLNILSKGSNYNALKETYIIFICTFDEFGEYLLYIFIKHAYNNFYQVKESGYFEKIKN